MPPIEIRPFRRSDRDQLTDLANAHGEAVVPGVTVPPNPDPSDGTLAFLRHVGFHELTRTTRAWTLA